MATVYDALIVPALKEIGVTGASETPTAGEADDALLALNRLIDQMAAQRLQMYAEGRTTWSITSGTPNYFLGPTSVTTGLILPIRPTRLDHVSFFDTSTPALEHQLPILTDDAFALYQKGFTNLWPQVCYYNPTFSLGNLILLPTPTDTGLVGALYYPDPVVEFAGLSTVVSLPPGYREMLVTNLAVNLASSYEKPLDPLLMKRAQDAIAVVKRNSAKLMDMSFDAGALISGGGSWDIRSGP